MNNIKQCLLISFSILFFVFNLSGQTITGKVVDAKNNSPLVASVVFIKGTHYKAETDTFGKYKIKIDSTCKVLVFSYIGYENKEIVINNQKVINVSLLRKDSALEDVTVTTSLGIKKQKKELGYSTASVSAATLSTHSSTLKTELTGKVAGLTVSDHDGVSDVGVVSKPVLPGVKTFKSKENIIAGTLTAGEINDFGKWNLWNDKSQQELSVHRKDWQICPSIRFSVLIQNEDGIAMVGQDVALLDKNKDTIWIAKTDNVGKSELWANMFIEKYNDRDKFSLVLNCNGNTYKIHKAKKFQQGINLFNIKKNCDVSNVVEAVFLVDGTGSMGDEINYLKVDLNDVIEKVKANNSNITLRLGSVFYRDKDQGDLYVTRKSDLSEDVTKTIDFIKLQNADGGGDYPEAVDEGLEVAINDMKWSENARTKIIFLILDAPPHQKPEVLLNMQRLTAKAAAMGIKIVPVTASGTDKSTEYLMRSLALCSNGTYVFLTDHSGVGDHHIDPTTDHFEVEKLNSVFIRLFKQFTEVISCKKELPKEVLETISDTSKITGYIKHQELPELDSVLIKKATKEFSCSYFPNPTTGIINIRIVGTVEELFLSDMSGKILERIKVNGRNRLQINISKYPNGIYLLRYYESDNNAVSGKIILNK